MDLSSLIKESGNEYAGIVADGIEAGDVESFIDTGSYALNALLSGSIYGGLASNKITAFAGESATGKTFFVLGVVKQFLEDNPDGGVIYFESESAITKQMIESRGIDSKRMVIMPVATIQEFSHQSTKILDIYLSQDKKERKPLMFCLDSLGMLSTSKEMADTSDGKETKDMTRAALTKASFRVLTLKLGKAKIPMLVTNHTYSQVGTMFPQQVMGGGCLTDGVNIQMSDGSLKNISEISDGEFVKTMNGDKEVLQTHQFNDKELYEIEFEDGYKIKCSSEHKFLIGDEWITAEEIFNDQVRYNEVVVV